jgi:hypothetical protein
MLVRGGDLSLLVLDADAGGSEMTPLPDAAPALQPAKVSHLLHGKYLVKPIFA